MGARRKLGCWKVHRGDQFIRLEVGLVIRSIFGQAMKISKSDLALAFRSAHPYDGLERGQGHAHVTGVRGNALITLAQNSVNAIEALERSAAAAWLPLIAGGKRGVIEIVAARALQEVATDGGHVTE